MKEKDKKALHDQIVKEVKQDFEERRQKRRPVELAWRLNMNFLMGNQYASITPTGDIDDYGRQYYWQEREVYNHIAPIVETRLAKLTRVKSGVSIRPAAPAAASWLRRSAPVGRWVGISSLNPPAAVDSPAPAPARCLPA